MQLSLRTDYALRMLMALASSDDVLSVDWMAERYGISRNHLAKVAQNLNAADFIVTSRGRSGGMRLSRPASQINVGQVVRVFERFDGFVGCMGAGDECPIDGVCGLKPALLSALEAFLAQLDHYSIADIANKPGAILRRLGSR